MLLMITTTERQPSDQVQADTLIVPVFEDRKEERFGAAELFDTGEVTGKPLELTLLHHPAGMAAKRVLLAGAGKAENFNAAELRKLAGAAVRHLKSKSIKSVALELGSGWSTWDTVSAAIEGALLGNYEPDRYKSTQNKPSVETFAVLTAADAEDLSAAAERGRILGEAQNFARDLVNEPANRLTPLKMAEAAQKTASEFHLECEVLDQEKMHQLGMGALLGVAQGSAEPPALIVLRYRPEKPAAHAHLGLVGKG